MPDSQFDSIFDIEESPSCYKPGCPLFELQSAMQKENQAREEFLYRVAQATADAQAQLWPRLNKGKCLNCRLRRDSRKNYYSEV